MTREASSSIDLILGTAGHIDHGKSTLIQALTGTDPDRLKEEKERGITIELGFAKLELPDGRTMGVVDVPGHEHFVKQMIAGATGVDVALLVIAADDGVMPQTVEHVAVLQTLGITRCVVALTKCDLVDAEWVEMMEEEVRTWLASTPYANAAVVPVSARTGQGLPELLQAIQDACAGVEHVRGGAAARYPIDRVFTIRGAGTVVTGTLWSGEVRPNDVLELLPGGRQIRVRGVQEHDQPVDVALAGNRVALNLANIGTDEVKVGDFLAEPGLITASDRFDARLTYLAPALEATGGVGGAGKPLESGVRLHVAHGTREVPGRILLANGQEQLEAGQSCYAQIRLEEPLPVSWGDRFVIRTWSPVRVVGGGVVLLAHPRRRTTLQDGETRALDALAAGQLQAAVEELVALAREPLTPDELANAIGTEAKPVASCLLDACDRGAAVQLGSARLYCAKALRQRVLTAIDHALISFHASHPQETGVGIEELRQTCAPRMASDKFAALATEAQAQGTAVVRAGKIGHPSAQASAVAIIENAADALAEELEGEGLAPQPFDYVVRDAGIDAGLAGQALTLLLDQGRARKLADDLYISQAARQEARQRVVQHLRAGGEGTAKALKDAMGTSRKFAIPLLESFDADGTTVREGDTRRLGK